MTFRSSPAAGGSEPDAIGKALEFVRRLQAEELPTSPLLEKANVNVGIIHGGQGKSVPSSECTVGLCMRCVTPTEQSHAIIRRCAGDAEIVTGYAAEPCTLFTLPGYPTGVALFGSDVSAYSRMEGTKVLMAGPGCIKDVHKVDEFVSLDELQAAAALYQRLVLDLKGLR